MPRIFGEANGAAEGSPRPSGSAVGSAGGSWETCSHRHARSIVGWVSHACPSFAHWGQALGGIPKYDLSARSVISPAVVFCFSASSLAAMITAPDKAI